MAVHKRPAEQQAAMSDTLAQFGSIRFIRDKIAHNGAWPRHNEMDEWRWGTFSHQRRKPTDGGEHFFSTDDLNHAAEDLETIRHRLDALLITEHPILLEEAHALGTFGPWRYKPAPQDGRGR